MGQQCRCKKGYCSEVDNKCSNCRTKKEQEAFLARPQLPIITVVNRHHGVSGEYIGRGNPLGNPWPIDNSIGDTREIVVARYGDWLDQQILEENDAVCDELNRLADIASSTGSLSLQCFCAPLLCHGNHIKRVLIQAFKE